VILLFGAGGQLGRAIVAQAAAARTPLTALRHGDVDITRASAVAAAVGRARPSLVVNAAAYTNVDGAEREPDVAMRINGDAARVVARAAAERGAPVVHISTDFVFDGRKAGAYTEEDAPSPLSAYARSKAAGEDAVRAATRSHVILRSAWLFGPDGSNFLHAILRLAASRDVIDVVSDQRGSPTPASALARAVLLVASGVAGGKAPWGTYHVAGSPAVSRFAFAEAIVSAFAKHNSRRPRINPVPSSAFPAAAARPANSALDSSKFAATFGWQPGDWHGAVEETIAALLAERKRA
jgi:dTDP-4-dehydrorhamnose reductase